jgi:hypothetical protein
LAVDSKDAKKRLQQATRAALAEGHFAIEKESDTFIGYAR